MTKRLTFLVASVLFCSALAHAISRGDTVTIYTSGYYLTATSRTDVGVATTPTVESLWIVEDISGSSNVQIKNLYYDNYLKIGSYGQSGKGRNVTYYGNLALDNTGDAFRLDNNILSSTGKGKVYHSYSSRTYMMYLTSTKRQVNTRNYSTFTFTKFTHKGDMVINPPYWTTDNHTFTYSPKDEQSVELYAHISVTVYDEYVGTNGQVIQGLSGTRTETNASTLSCPPYNLQVKEFLINGVDLNDPGVSWPYKASSGLVYETYRYVNDGSYGVPCETDGFNAAFAYQQPDKTDTIIIRWDDTISLTAYVTRKYYYETKLDNYFLNVTPGYYLFSYQAGAENAVFLANIVTRNGTVVKDNEGNEVEANYTETVDAIDYSKLQMAVVDSNLMACAWLNASVAATSGIVMTTSQDNYTANLRGATMNLYYENDTHDTIATARIPIEQSNYASGTYNFMHQTGVVGSPLMSNGMQQTHTVERTIYAITGSYVTLTLKETDFRGWERWYNYNNDHDLSEINASIWRRQPDGFKMLGTVGNAMGRYRTMMTGALTAPQVNMVSNAPFDVACDVSNYTDFTITSSSVTEPTLSYREIFHIRPASEMASRLAATTGTDDYVEEYNLIAPTNVRVSLTPEYNYRKVSDESKMCYIYEDGGTYYRIGADDAEEAVWYASGATPISTISVSEGSAVTSVAGVHNTTNYLILPARSWEGVDTFTLRTKNYNLCRFVVHFQDINTVGPKMESGGRAIITAAEMRDNYQILTSLNFDYDQPNTDAMVIYNHPLPWAECASGFAYGNTSNPTDNRSTAGSFPYWGEYQFLNKITGLSFLHNIEQHGGAKNGYMLYCDGTMDPGLVASLSVRQKLCSGQKMFCSAWINNCANPSDVSKCDRMPKFRFVIEGKNEGESSWHQVSQYITGDVDNNPGWRQVVFGIDLQDDYDYYQIRIYNFASSNQANDFAIDDICIFASRLPMMVYQASTACAAHEDNIQTIIRLDYQGLGSDEFYGTNFYYQVYDSTHHTAVQMAQAGYINPNAGNTYGMFTIPTLGYDPSTDPSVETYSQISELVDAHSLDHNKVFGYVREYVDGDWRWVIYIIHDADLSSENIYQVRMATSPHDFANTLCSLRADLPIANRVQLEINGVVLSTHVATELCVNDLYNVRMRVFDVDPNNPGGTVQGNCLNDWLLCPDTSAAYCTATYGYTFSEIVSAISYDLRRVGGANPNLRINNVADINQAVLINPRTYDIVSHLVDGGWLQLGVEGLDVYLPATTSEDSVCYAILPIVGTGYREDDASIEIPVCQKPFFAKLKPKTIGDYDLQLGAMPRDMMPEHYQNIPPRVRTSKQVNTGALRVPIQYIKNAVMQSPITLYSSTDPNVTSSSWFGFTTDKTYDFENPTLYYKTGDTVRLTALSSSSCPAGKNYYGLREGYEYTFLISLLTKTNSRSVPGSSDCEVGYSFITVVVVPDTLIWSPSMSDPNNWCNDANWQRSNGAALELGQGYIPMSHSEVIIPNTVSYPILQDTMPIYEVNLQVRDCHNIVMQTGTMMMHQDYLRYNHAFVDMMVPSAYWQLVSPPLQDVVAGDMFIPDGTTTNDDDLFAPGLFSGNRWTPYAFWQSYFSKTVPFIMEESAHDYTISSANWGATTNVVSEPHLRGHAYALLGFGETDEENLPLVVRLPKADIQYSYYYEGASSGVRTVSIARSENNYHFAYQTDDAEEDSICLINETTGNLFAFGNPTMAYINMREFLSGNDLLPIFYYVDQSNWKAHNARSMLDDDYYLAPMEGVLVQTKKDTTALPIRLTKSMLSIDMGEGKDAAHRPAKAKDAALLFIEAENNEYTAMTTLVKIADADNGYVDGEDALVLTSGQGQTYSDAVFNTPVTIATATEDKALMLDIRKEWKKVPIVVSFLTQMNDETTFTFSFSNLDKVYYFCDTKSGNRLPIINGVSYVVPTPESGELRYYIEADSEGEDVGTSLSESTEKLGHDDAQITMLRMGEHIVTVFATEPIESVACYDVMGRCLSRIDGKKSLSLMLNIPDGVSIVKATTAHSCATTKYIAK